MANTLPDGTFFAIGMVVIPVFAPITIIFAFFGNKVVKYINSFLFLYKESVEILKIVKVKR